MKKFVGVFILMLVFTSMHAQEVIKGTYAIKNVQTGMVLRIKDANSKNGTPIVAYDPVNWKCVTWDFKHIDGQTYQLRNLFSGKTLQPVDVNAAPGNALEEQPLNNRDVQQYEFILVDKDVYLIKLKGTDLYITPSDKEGTVNSHIILSKKEGDKLQQWTIYEQHPTI
ncbi:MAG TPA: RICIN domain-containing protein [Parafilimonas sp.]|nr:RICIN domain-containing protein [Parafilimonas sp.]